RGTTQPPRAAGRLGPGRGADLGRGIGGHARYRRVARVPGDRDPARRAAGRRLPPGSRSRPAVTSVLDETRASTQAEALDTDLPEAAVLPEASPVEPRGSADTDTEGPL